MESDSEEIIQIFGDKIEDVEEECALWLKRVNKLESELAEAKSKYSAAKKKLNVLMKEKKITDNREQLQKCRENLEKNWINKNFEWSESVLELLKRKFKFDSFRPMQLAAINATLTKKDVIIVMPTGGGKSLIYQLPALIDKGFTVVVSPLISLIEDQLISLNHFQINAATINGATLQEEVKNIYKQMVDKNSKLKLLFVTPEMLGKSKRFMMNLKKAYEAGLVARLAVDEVHCCSTWGHDFRPDYKFLGLVRAALTGVPFLGLTATATSDVIIDIQDVLALKDCLIITAPFNRPNLYYEVIDKPSTSEQTVQYLSFLIKNKYSNESGIIYTNTVNDSITLAQNLKSEGITVAPYHAQLEHDQKKKIHEKWLAKTYQVVVATVAFGMGIDKPDVRFVIHHTVPRTMESLYQESGRAGRDGQKADCLILFSLNDYLKVLGNVSSVTQEKKAVSVLEYCLEKQRCRRAVISKHFEEVWERSQCNKMCDNCAKRTSFFSYNITQMCRDFQEIITSSEEQLTLNKLINCWFKKAKTTSKKINSDLTKTKVELVVGHLLLHKYLSIYRGYTSYSTICYIQQGIPVTEPIEMVTTHTYIGVPKKEILNSKEDTNDPPVKKAKKHNS